MWYVHYYGQFIELTYLTVTSDDHGVIGELSDISKWSTMKTDDHGVIGELSDISKWSTMKNQSPQVCSSWVEV